MKFWRLRWAELVAWMETKNACKILIGKRLEKHLLGRTRRMWENNFKMNFNECGLG
jgi:hypothetical protein